MSSSSLTVLAVEKYYAILKPFRTGLWLNGDNIKKTIAVIWISSILICLPEIFFKKLERTVCNMYRSFDFTYEPGEHNLPNAAITFMEMAVMLYCYGSLVRGLYFTNTVCPEIDTETC